jgi:hypothetical protein
MEKVLNQEEIDAMVRRAGESITAFSTPSSKSSIVSPPNERRAQLSKFFSSSQDPPHSSRSCAPAGISELSSAMECGVL